MKLFFTCFSSILVISLCKVASVVGMSAYGLINATLFTYSYGVDVSNNCQTHDASNVTCVYNISNGDYLGFNQVDFEEGATRVSIHLAEYLDTADPWARIRFSLNSPVTPPFHTMTIGRTNPPVTWITLNEFLDFGPAAMGIQNLYLTFDIGSYDSSFVLVDWLQFFK